MLKGSKSIDIQHRLALGGYAQAIPTAGAALS
jgi:hypothetical protein